MNEDDLLRLIEKSKLNKKPKDLELINELNSCLNFFSKDLIVFYDICYKKDKKLFTDLLSYFVSSVLLNITNDVDEAVNTNKELNIKVFDLIKMIDKELNK